MQGNKSKNRKMGLYQNKNLLLYKANIQQSEGKIKGIGKMFPNYAYNKVLISGIYKRVKKFNKANNAFKKSTLQAGIFSKEQKQKVHRNNKKKSLHDHKP